MKALEGKTRVVYLAFFASHIVFTLIVDVQAIAPPSYFPTPFRILLDWYRSIFRDPLFPPSGSPTWFQSLVWCEMVFQLPFFFAACRQLRHNGNNDSTGGGIGSSHAASSSHYYPDWFRCACIAYGAHTSTIMVPILFAIMSSKDNTRTEKAALVSLYLPYLILPLGILRIACYPYNDGIVSDGKATNAGGRHGVNLKKQS
jgi:hypothetical protein